MQGTKDQVRQRSLAQSAVWAGTTQQGAAGQGQGQPGLAYRGCSCPTWCSEAVPARRTELPWASSGLEGGPWAELSLPGGALAKSGLRWGLALPVKHFGPGAWGAISFGPLHSSGSHCTKTGPGQAPQAGSGFSRALGLPCCLGRLSLLGTLVPFLGCCGLWCWGRAGLWRLTDQAVCLVVFCDGVHCIPVAETSLQAGAAGLGRAWSTLSPRQLPECGPAVQNPHAQTALECPMEAPGGTCRRL